MPTAKPPVAPSATDALGAAAVNGRGATWALEAFRRVRTLFWLKTVGVTAFMWLFFLAYFELLRAPARPTLVMPLTALDHAIGFQPWAVVPYVSLWVYVSIAPGLMASLRELAAYGLWVGAMCLLGLGCFLLWPTAVPASAQAIGVDGQPMLALLRGVDAAGNACPSMHVAAALFSAAWLAQLLREMGASAAWRALSWIWAAAIVYSTLAIKQHVLIDVLTGALLGWGVAALAIGLRRDGRGGWPHPAR